MRLIDYISCMRRRSALADACGTSTDWLYQIATAWNGRKAGHKLATSIEIATRGLVTRQDLRPDIFGPLNTDSPSNFPKHKPLPAGEHDRDDVSARAVIPTS